MLWLISFMLHAALIYFVIILYTRMNSLKATEQKQRELLEILRDVERLSELRAIVRTMQPADKQVLRLDINEAARRINALENIARGVKCH